MSDAPTSTPTAGATRPARRRPPPNYAARRMLASTILITVVVAIVVIAWRAVRGGDDGVGGTAGTWDEIALVDRTTGEITFVDADGEVTGSIVGAGRVTDVHAHGDRLAIVGADRVVLASNGDDTPIDLTIARSDRVGVLSTLDSFHLTIGAPTGGNIIVLDGETGETFDVGALAEQPSPLMFVETLRHAADGGAFAVADAANFQTIVVRPGEPEPSFFPDQPVAVGDALIATSQVVGQEADVTLFDADRNSKGRATIDIPAGGVMVGDDLVVVSVEGSVARLVRDATEAERIGEVAVPAGATVVRVWPTAGGERLVVAGPVFQAVIDLDGRTVFTTTFTSAVDATRPMITWACLPVGGPGGYHSLISLDTGEQLADLTGLEVTGTASDGCSVLGERAGVTELVTAEGSVRLGNVRAAWLGPDGRSIVQRTSAGSLELVRVDDELRLGEAVDLSSVAPSDLIVAFVDD